MKDNESINTHGGRREGSGRKRIKQIEARELFCDAVDARWETIMAKVDALIDKGDFATLRWIIEQRIGKPLQDKPTTDGEPLTVIIKQWESLDEVEKVLDK